MRRAATDFSYHSSAARAVASALDVPSSIVRPLSGDAGAPDAAGLNGMEEAAATAGCVDGGVVTALCFISAPASTTDEIACCSAANEFVAPGDRGEALARGVRNGAEDSSSCLHCSGVRL